MISGTSFGVAEKILAHEMDGFSGTLRVYHSDFRINSGTRPMRAKLRNVISAFTQSSSLPYADLSSIDPSTPFLRFRAIRKIRKNRNIEHVKTPTLYSSLSRGIAFCIHTDIFTYF